MSKINGLRELKKQRTRKAISDLATALFIKRGYHEVTTAEIAELAEVSVPTLFKYFPTKESLVFDEDVETEGWLVAAVENRQKGQSITEALLNAGLRSIDEVPKEHKKNFKTFMNLVERTPELSLYAKQMWMRHEKSLSEVIRKTSPSKMSKLQSESIAHFALDSFHRAMGESNSKSALKELFKILTSGWSE